MQLPPATTFGCAFALAVIGCGKKFLALVKCQIAKEKCGADGKIDQSATMDLCKLEDTALRNCDQAKAADAKPRATAP